MKRRCSSQRRRRRRQPSVRRGWDLVFTSKFSPLPEPDDKCGAFVFWMRAHVQEFEHTHAISYTAAESDQLMEVHHPNMNVTTCALDLSLEYMFPGKLKQITVEVGNWFAFSIFLVTGKDIFIDFSFRFLNILSMSNHWVINYMAFKHNPCHSRKNAVTNNYKTSQKFWHLLIKH